MAESKTTKKPAAKKPAAKTPRKQKFLVNRDFTDTLLGVEFVKGEVVDLVPTDHVSGLVDAGWLYQWVRGRPVKERREQPRDGDKDDLRNADTGEAKTEKETKEAGADESETTD